MFGFKSFKNEVVASNGIDNLKREAVRKMRYTANIIIASDEKGARDINGRANVLEADTNATLDTISVSTIAAGVDFRTEMDSFLRLSRM